MQTVHQAITEAMTASQTPVSAPSVVGAEPGPTPRPPGRFGQMGLVVSLVIDPRFDPLPEIDVSSAGIPTIRFAEEFGTDLVIYVQQRAPKESQAAYLYAFGASLTALARQIEEEDR